MRNSPCQIRLPNNLTVDKIGVLTLKLNDHWTILAFSDFLRLFEDAYSNFSLFFYVSEFINKENDIEKLTKELESLNYIDNNQLLEYEKNFIPLTLSQIKISSGFLELIGEINPLRIIADFIIQWEKQNIGKRVSVTREFLDRFTSNIDSWKLVLAQIDKFPKNQRNNVYECFIAKTILNPQFSLVDISDNLKLNSIELHGV
jgi:hypothetical protein